jgi:hypothetical protein
MGPPQRSPVARSIARAVRGASGMVTTLAALAGDGQSPVPAFQAQLLDIGAGGLRDPQPVQGKQGDQRVLQRSQALRWEALRITGIAIITQLA